MIRTLLFLLFFILLAADTLGVNKSLAPGLSVKNAFLYLIFLGIATETALKRNRRIELVTVLAPYALYFFYAASTLLIISLFAFYGDYHLRPAIIALKGLVADNLLILLVFFYGVLAPKDSLWLLKMIIWTVVVGNIVTVIDMFNLPDLGLITTTYGRSNGLIGEPNQSAVFLALFLPATIAMVFIERGALRYLAILGVLASLIALLLTVSRGGFVGVLGGSLIAAVFLREFLSGKAVVSTIGAIVVVGCCALGVLYMTGHVDLLIERTIVDTTRGTASTASSGRTWIWAAALNKMLDQPLSLITGYGWDTYFQMGNFRFAPHNSYLRIFFETGVIGLLLVTFALGNVLRTARAGLRLADANTAPFLMAFVFGMSGALVAIFFVDTSLLFIWAFSGAALRLAILQQGSFSAGTRRGDKFETLHRPGG